MIEIGPALSAVETALAALGESKTARMETRNFLGEECMTVAELAATNRKTELGAAAFAIQHKSMVEPLLYESAVRYMKQFRPGPESNKNGVAVVVTFGMDARKQIAQQGGEPPEDLHITIGYFGDQLGEKFITALTNIVPRLANEFDPFRVNLNGLTRFSANDPDAPDVMVLNADAPVLSAIRRMLGTMCNEEGFGWDDTHGFSPHCTLGYLDRDDDMPLSRWTPTTVMVESIELWTREHLAFPFKLKAVVGAEPDTEQKDVFRGTGQGGVPDRKKRRKELIERCAKVAKS